MSENDLNLMGLAHEVRRRTGLSRSQAHGATVAVLDSIALALVEGGRVVLGNFGTFETVVRRYGLNPVSKSEGEVTAVKFRATGALRNAANNRETFTTVTRQYSDR